jgi:hypothetical protein
VDLLETVLRERAALGEPTARWTIDEIDRLRRTEDAVRADERQRISSLVRRLADEYPTGATADLLAAAISQREAGIR